MANSKSTLRFVSWNTNGLKKKGKLLIIKRRLLKYKSDVVFLQETHIGPTCLPEFEDDEEWDVFFTVHHFNSKGVAILIKKGIDFKYICHDEDYCGGYIVLFCYLYGELYTLVNVYNHKYDTRMLLRLNNYLMETKDGVLVVGGDFNESELLQPFLEEFTKSLKLNDIWLHQKSNGDEGNTRFQNESRSRLDRFFTSSETLERVHKINVKKYKDNEEKVSDHLPLVLKFRIHQEPKHKTLKLVSCMNEHKYTPKRKAAKINGAEIIIAIKSLINACEGRPAVCGMYEYINDYISKIEVLKTEYNYMLDEDYIFKKLRKCSCTTDKHLNAKYFIFLKILASRLKELTFLFGKEKKRSCKSKCWPKRYKILPAKQTSQNIRWSFLRDTISKGQKILNAPQWSPNILNSILPTVTESSKVFKKLEDEFPLTNPICKWAQKQLDYMVFENSQVVEAFKEISGLTTNVYS